MREEQKISLYRMISVARESCAGSNVKPISLVLKMVRDALQYAVFIGASITTVNRLIGVEQLLLEATEYNHRLIPDTVLCDILNEMDKGSREE